MIQLRHPTRVRARTAALWACVAAAFLASACSGGDGAMPDGLEVVPIGFIGPLSGGAAFFGRNVERGLEMAAAEIEEAGGFEVDGRRVRFEIVSIDDRYLPYETATAARRLLQQRQVSVVFTAHAGGVRTLQEMNVADPRFLVVAHTSEPSLLEAENPLTVMLNPRFDWYEGPYTRVLMERFGPRLSLLATTTVYGRAWTEHISAEWTRQGGTVGSDGGVDYNTTTDFTGPVTRALDEDPDVLFIGGPSQPTALVVRAARQQGFEGGFMLLDQAKFAEMLEIVPIDRLEGSMGAFPQEWYPAPGTSAFVERYYARYGEDFRSPTSEVAIPHQGLHLVARAMEIAGTTEDADAIRAAMDEAARTVREDFRIFDMQGVTSAGHLIRPAFAAHVVDGDFVPVPLGGTELPTSQEVVSSPLSTTTEAWWAYERPATFDVVRTEVDVPVRDGTLIGCELGRPAMEGGPAPGAFPGLIVEFTPYVVLAGSYRAEADFFVRRGYNALVCTLRGSGRSGGTWQHAMSSQDGRDAHDLVEWLADQPFSDGRIGQLGESYGGQTSYGSAVEAAPSLRAVAPMQPPSNLYDDVIYPGGIKSTERGGIDSWPPAAERITAGAVNAEAEYAVNREHPTFDAYWRDRALLGRHDAIRVPVLTIGGWEDGYFRSGTLANIEAAPDRTWAIYGPWPHRNPIDYDDCSGCPVEYLPSGVLLAWFDHWVMELPDVPVPPEPTFVSFEGPNGVGAGWRELSEWIPKSESRSAAGMTYALAPDGRLAPDAAASGTAASGTVALRQPLEPEEPGGAVVFTSEPLEADRVLVGHPTLTLRATLSAPDAHFYVELIDVDPSGEESVVNDGFLKASHRSSHVAPEPVPVGVRTDFDIGIRPDHHRFPAGHRVRVRVSGGPSRLLERPDEPVEITVHLDGASELFVPTLPPER